MKNPADHDPKPEASQTPAETLKALAAALETGADVPDPARIREILASFKAGGLDKPTQEMVIEAREDARKGVRPDPLALRMIAKAISSRPAGAPARKKTAPLKPAAGLKDWEPENRHRLADRLGIREETDRLATAVLAAETRATVSKDLDAPGLAVDIGALRAGDDVNAQAAEQILKYAEERIGRPLEPGEIAAAITKVEAAEHLQPARAGTAPGDIDTSAVAKLKVETIVNTMPTAVLGEPRAAVNPATFETSPAIDDLEEGEFVDDIPDDRPFLERATTAPGDIDTSAGARFVDVATSSTEDVLTARATTPGDHFWMHDSTSSIHRSVEGVAGLVCDPKAPINEKSVCVNSSSLLAYSKDSADYAPPWSFCPRCFAGTEHDPKKIEQEEPITGRVSFAKPNGLNDPASGGIASPIAQFDVLKGVNYVDGFDVSAYEIDQEIPATVRTDAEWVALAADVIEHLSMPAHAELCGELYALAQKLEENPIPDPSEAPLLDRVEAEIERRIEKALKSPADLPAWVITWAQTTRAQNSRDSLFQGMRYGKKD